MQKARTPPAGVQAGSLHWELWRPSRMRHSRCATQQQNATQQSQPRGYGQQGWVPVCLAECTPQQSAPKSQPQGLRTASVPQQNLWRRVIQMNGSDSFMNIPEVLMTNFRSIKGSASASLSLENRQCKEFLANGFQTKTNSSLNDAWGSGLTKGDLMMKSYIAIQSTCSMG